VSDVGRVFGAVLRNRDLRRVELAFVGFNASEFAVWIALIVYAYRRGGATEASVAVVVQLVPAAAFAPFAAVLADRLAPARVLAGGYLAQAVGMGATAVAIVAGAPRPLTYAAAALASTAVTITRPTQAALLPFLARSADELTATNVVSAWVENGSILVATTATGVLLGIAGVALVFGLMAGVVLCSAALVAGVDGPQPDPAPVEDVPRTDALDGFRVLARHARPRLLASILLLELTIFGALDILFVVLAFDVLHRGGGWAGYLNAAFAAGGTIGSMAAVVLVGRHRLAPALVAGMLLWGLAFGMIAVWPSAAAAILLLVVAGSGRSLLDVGCRTLLQRTTPQEMLGRVFGVLEGLNMAGLALGALIVPPLVALGGATTAVVGVPALLLLATALAARPLIAIDRSVQVPVVEIALLRSMTLFRSLPAPALEGLAHALEPVHVPGGQVVIRAGDEGDRYYAIAEGRADVTRNGAVRARLGRGDGFGEIALLEDVPRTATVTAITDLRLYALDKEPFVTSVTGHAPTAGVASALVRELRRADETDAD
jgi:hypothetical protein